MSRKTSTGPDDGTGCGFVNAHTHLYSGLAPLGLPAPSPPPTNFVEILERVWWRLDRALDEASLRASAELYVVEAIGLGTCALFDHHESPAFVEGSLDVLAAVCEEFQMHALLTYGATERNGGLEEARRGLNECRRFLTASQGSDFVRGAVGLHASFTVSDETIRAAGALALEHDAPLHVHVAEDHADVEDAKQRGFRGVLDRLDQLGALLPGAILAHGVHLTRDEVALASERGCWLVQNPRSNRGNQVGYPAHLDAASLVALGTDGYPSDLRVERDTLLEDATEAEVRGAAGELASAERRLTAGGALARTLFPGLTRPPSVAPDRARAIRRNAQEQAQRLFQRMAELP